MTDLNAPSAQRRKKLTGSPLLVRWLVGGFLGFVGSAIMYLALDYGFFPPLIGPALAGQEEMIESLCFAMSDSFISYSGRLGYLALFLRSTIWGLIGALLASGRKKQAISGLVLLALYFISGFLFYYIILGSVIVS